MTSRIPPSRRDPQYAAQRAAKVVGQQTPGAGRVAGVAKQGVSQPVAAAIRGSKATPVEGGGGGIGYAVVQFGFPSFTTPDTVTATSSSLLYSSGSAGISATGGAADYCIDNLDCIYTEVVMFSNFWESGGPLSDVYMLTFTGSFADGDVTYLCGGSPRMTGVGAMNAAGSITPDISLVTTGGAVLIGAGTVTVAIIRSLA